MPDGALYWSLILYVSPASIHRTVVKAFKDNTNFKPLHYEQFLEYKIQRPWSSVFQLSNKKSLKSFLGFFLDKTHLKMQNYPWNGSGQMC